MKVYDLTYAISTSMPVYPGMEAPTLSSAATVEQDGYHETKIAMYSHTGTHMDAPAHIFRGAPTLDVLPPESFAGAVYVLDCSELGQRNRSAMRSFCCCIPAGRSIGAAMPIMTASLC